MKSLQWEPLDELALVRESLDEHLSGIIRRPRGGASFHRMPAVEMFSDDAEVVVRAEIPGCSNKDIDIWVDGTVLTIKANIAGEEIHKNRQYQFCEIRRGTVLRRLRLPCAVNGDQATAVCGMGVLEIRLPKARQVKSVPAKVRVAGVLPG